ncbi:hypothetical protein JOQ06_023058 [Pogonophryne albipinna]|uniref:Uncharacterized protein n=1 Tax=Pogonophryne albipinna TaxID=1090488 RepID=A0AAD6F3G3_9TELE|nr:hypothetical protein JOQ06_023058 [Pogonophryne albipinna]
MAGCMKMKNGFTSLFMISMCLLLISSPKTSGQRGAVSGNNRLPVTDLQDGEESVVSGSNRFCYKNSVVPSWRQTWTRIQVKVWSSNVFKVQMAEGEEELQELERFSVWSWMQSLLRERQNETTINIGLFSKKTCFKIDPAGETSFTVKALRSEWEPHMDSR